LTAQIEQHYIRFAELEKREMHEGGPIKKQSKPESHGK